MLWGVIRERRKKVLGMELGDKKETREKQNKARKGVGRGEE